LAKIAEIGRPATRRGALAPGIEATLWRAVKSGLPETIDCEATNFLVGKYYSMKSFDLGQE
jgi:hypothetical protein